MAANEIILRSTLKEELIAGRQAPMGGRRERAGGNLGFRVSGLSYMPRAGRRPTKTVGGGSHKKKIHILDRLGWPARDIYISHPARARLPPKTFSPLGFEIPTLARSRRFQQRDSSFVF